MNRLTIAFAAAVALAATPMVAQAAPCKDARGKFIKCPPAKPAPRKVCKGHKGKFVKCPR
ncbi:MULTISPECIES: hypothetical protein [unclassified Sphingomonas]|uniref:hypothetical protein n=1 Tax=Novosphingobium rhizosphaerae TaxID=1551649 RepID=UPI0015CBAD5B